ncbi:MAG: nuclear transport factor 2 family protein [Burkholderiaceae bacterium]
MTRPDDPRFARLVALFEGLTAADVARLGAYYADDARFKDPFNDAVGLAEVQRILGHMFVALEAPRFVVHEAVVQGDQAFLTWDFHFRFRRGDRAEQTVCGASHIVLDATGRIALHRDYWDAAEELYEKLPLLGGLMRFVKRRINAAG